MDHYVTNSCEILHDGIVAVLTLNANLHVQNGPLLRVRRVVVEAGGVRFERIELLVPLLLHPRTAAVACFVLRKHMCKVWACSKGGPAWGQSPRHEVPYLTIYCPIGCSIEP